MTTLNLFNYLIAILEHHRVMSGATPKREVYGQVEATHLPDSSHYSKNEKNDKTNLFIF
jgi:hypothetical protein